MTGPDGSTVVTVTKPDGTVTTTTTDTEGNRTQVVQSTDGSSQTSVAAADGSSSLTVVDAEDRVVSQASLTRAALEAAQAEGGPAALPLPELPLSTDWAAAPVVTVSLPVGGSVWVEFPVKDVTPGTVAVLIGPDGAEEVIKSSFPTENGVAAALSDGDTVKLVDNSRSFADVSASYWGADAVAFVSARGIFEGTGDAAFSPESAMSRAMIVTVLARFEGVDTTGGSTWYDAGQKWAIESGISGGADLNGTVTREQLVTMLWRLSGEPVVDFLLTAADAGSVSSWAYEAMRWAVSEGIIEGVTDTTIVPQGSATRAQCAAILMRLCAGAAD